MTALIQELIDKQDSFEIIRDLIAQILAEESASQQALAVSVGKDPNEWKLRVFTERTNPFEQFQNDVTDPAFDNSPIVNVWYEGSTFDMSRSNLTERQEGPATYNIDIYGAGVSSDNPSGGHFAGDKLAALKSQQGTRLVRNILMSGYYTRLGFGKVNKTVGSRWISAITPFQPQLGTEYVTNVTATRIVFTVVIDEYSPQYVPVDLEELRVDLKRAEDGSILAQALYDYT